MSSAPSRYTRSNFPLRYLDTAAWPAVAFEDFDVPTRTRFENYQRAARAYLDGEPLKPVCRACSVAPANLLRLLNRALEQHPDGRIWGWRAFVRFAHIKVYQRFLAPGTESEGLSGAFHQFLDTHPALKDALTEKILNPKKKLRDNAPAALPESRSGHLELYGHFKRLCRQTGIFETHYPLNTKDRGKRALRRYVDEVRQAHFSATASALGGPDAAVRSRVGGGALPHVIPRVPFDFVSLDAHRLNFIGCIGMPTPDRGIAAVPISRLIFIPVLELACRVILGYRVAICREPNAQDVTEAVRHALDVWSPRKLSLPGFSYPPGAGLPSGVIPEAAGLCWNAILVDNAAIHLSHAYAETLRNRLGCAINYGPVLQWYRRSPIEALFSSLERHGFSRLPNSTGYGPADPLRPDAAAAAVKYRIMLEELLDLIDVIVCTYNATPQRYLDDRSPLDAIADALAAAPDTWLPRRLPPLPPSVPALDESVMRCTVRGNVKTGRRPYVQLSCVRYTNATLSNLPALIGTTLVVHVRDSDLRTVRAFLPNGSELGVLTALGAWSQTKHDRKLRTDILSAMRDGHFVVPEGCDPIQEYMYAKAKQLRVEESKKRAGRSRISSIGTSLARTTQITDTRLNDVIVPDPRSTADTAVTDTADPPSYIPKIQHRGFL